jgi:hypothetical protein
MKRTRFETIAAHITSAGKQDKDTECQPKHY